MVYKKYTTAKDDSKGHICALQLIATILTGKYITFGAIKMLPVTILFHKM